MNSVRAARPTVYAGVRMRSRLEAGFAQWLDQMRLPWEYEPVCLAAPSLGQWLPDFKVTVPWLNSEQTSRWWFDVKPKIVPKEDLLRWANILASADFFDPFVDVCGLVFPGKVFAVQDGHLSPYEWALRGLVDGEQQYRGHVALVPVLPTAMGPWQGEWWKGD